MSTRDEKSGFGVFRVGERLIGVPIENLAEVCVVPGVSKLMVPDGPLLGAFDLRGSLVPLIDIVALSGIAERDQPTQSAAVLQHGDRVAAIALDEIVSLTEAKPTGTIKGAPDASLRDEIGDTDRPPLFPSGFVMNGEIVSCLDAAALFRRPEFLSIASTRAGDRSTGSVRDRKFLIVSVGGAHFGIDTEHVWATVPEKAIEMTDVVNEGSPCLGFIEHHGWRIPVVHTNRIFDLGRSDRPNTTEVVVLRFPNGHLLGLNVDGTERLSALPQDRMHDSNALIRSKGFLPKVCVDGEDTQIFLVDYKALSGNADMQSLASLTDRKTAQKEIRKESTETDKNVVRESVRYLIFEAGTKRAVPAHQVTRILHVPDRIVPADEMSSRVKGFFTFGDRSVPLVSLNHGPDEIDRDGYVLLVTVAGNSVGFLADRICNLQTSEWRMPDKARGHGSADLIQLRSNGGTSILPMAELRTLAEEFIDVTLPAHTTGAAEPELSEGLER